MLPHCFIASPKLSPQLERTTFPSRGGPSFSQGYIRSAVPARTSRQAFQKNKPKETCSHENLKLAALMARVCDLSIWEMNVCVCVSGDEDKKFRSSRSSWTKQNSESASVMRPCCKAPQNFRKRCLVELKSV